MKFFQKNLALMIGMVAGAMAGYLYYHYVGCNGQCLISSSPVISTLYGALLGGLTANLFRNRNVSESSD